MTRWSIKYLPIYFLMLSFFSCADLSSALLYFPNKQEFDLGACDLNMRAMPRSGPSEDAKKDSAKKWKAELINAMAQSEEIAFFKLPNENKGTIIYFHGNADTACRSAASKSYPDAVDRIFYEYPGYYRNILSAQSEVNEKRIIANATAFFDKFLKTFTKPIFIHGQSVGTGIATYLAAHYPDDIAGLILTTPYPSIDEVAANKNGLAGFVMYGNQWIASEWARKVKAPVLIVHGDRDTVIPFEFGVWQATNFVNTQVDFVTVLGLGHNNIKDAQATETFINKILTR